MRVRSLTLRNYRNFAEESLVFSPSANLILGKNGQGKTNLLEALYCLSHTRSHRTRSDRELVRIGETGGAIEAVVGSRTSTETLLAARFDLNPPEGPLKTVFRINGQAQKSRSQLIGALPGVAFFVTDLLLLRGAPEDRRRWLDAAIAQYDRRHFQAVQDFNRVRAQKSRLLREGQQPGIQADIKANLEAWNEQFAVTAARVMLSRLRYLEGPLQDLAVLHYLKLSAGREALTMAYHSDVLADLLIDPIEERASLTEADLAQPLRRELADRMPQECQRGVCLVGPHREDVRFFLNGLEACAYGSQGQQRAIVLALKLAELALLSAKIGEPPVLLLDDVMAELDPERQQVLLSEIQGETQVFVSTTHLDASLDPVNRLPSARVFRVEAGRVTVEDAVHAR